MNDKSFQIEVEAEPDGEYDPIPKGVRLVLLFEELVCPEGHIHSGVLELFTVDRRGIIYTIEQLQNYVHALGWREMTDVDRERALQVQLGELLKQYMTPHPKGDA